MIGIVRRKEVLEMTRDGRFRWAAGVIFTLLALALLLGWKQHSEIERQHADARKATREHWLGQGRKNPHSAAHYGIYAFKPKLPMALLDKGTDSFTGVAVWLEAHKQNEFQFRPARDATMLARFGELTAAGVLQILIPLLIVVLTFGAFSGEREQGTLRQLLSLGVDRRELAAGKAMGVAAAMALLLTPAAALGSLVLVLASGTASMASAAPRAAVLAVSYLLYFAAFLGISLAVSARVRSSRLSLLILLGFWIANCLVAPRAATDLSKRLYPTPSAFTFAQQVAADLKNGVDGHDPADQRAARLLATVMRQYNVSRIEHLPVNFSGISLQAGEEHGNEVYDRRYGELWAQFDRQNRLQQAGGVVAPLLGIRAASMGLAGTDFAQHRHFAAAAEDYRRMLNRAMNQEITEKAPKNAPYLAGDDLWSRVPPFEYDAPGVGWVLGNVWPGLLALAGWALAGFALAAVSAARIEVE